MRKVVLVLVAVLAFNLSNAQRITYEELSSATKKPKGKFTEYVTSRGDVLKIGDKVTLGNPSNNNNFFVYIFSVIPMANPTLAGIRAQGWESEILKFRIAGSKRRGFSVYIVGKSPTGVDRYNYDYEMALSVGEVLADGLSREQAIAKLKESKELFELDMISEEEFESVKKELTPIIKNNNKF